jgi:hypothetical protein
MGISYLSMAHSLIRSYSIASRQQLGLSNEWIWLNSEYSFDVGLCVAIVIEQLTGSVECMALAWLEKMDNMPNM